MRSRIEGNNLHLPEQLAREDYERVAKAIKAAGGKWNRQAGCHVFPGDVRQTLNIGAESVEVVNVQQTYQAFYTPPEIAQAMAEAANLYVAEPWLRVLEPSAGRGRLVDAIGTATDWSVAITAVEIDDRAGFDLLNAYAGTRASLMVIRGDFLQQRDLGDFDRIVMNPPFTGGQDIAHIKHALTLLRPGGRLVALCAGGPKQEAALRPLARDWQRLPAGAFKESGTNIAVAMLTIEKRAQATPAPVKRQAPPAAPPTHTFGRALQAEFAL